MRYMGTHDLESLSTRFRNELEIKKPTDEANRPPAAEATDPKARGAPDAR